MLMYDDKREIKYYNNDISQESIIVGRDGVTKIEVYNELYGEGIVPYLAVWVGDVIKMRTPAIGKEIVYK